MKIECTEKQALIIEIALDTLSRMCSGQLNEMIYGMEWLLEDTFPYMNGKREERDIILSKLKTLLFPELSDNASYGVGQKEIGDAQVAYEMVKKLQNFRVRNDKNNPHSVLHHEPLHYSKEPLIKVGESDE